MMMENVSSFSEIYPPKLVLKKENLSNDEGSVFIIIYILK